MKLWWALVRMSTKGRGWLETYYVHWRRKEKELGGRARLYTENYLSGSKHMSRQKFPRKKKNQKTRYMRANVYDVTWHNVLFSWLVVQYRESQKAPSRQSITSSSFALVITVQGLLEHSTSDRGHCDIPGLLQQSYMYKQQSFMYKQQSYSTGCCLWGPDIKIDNAYLFLQAQIFGGSSLN